MKNIHFPCNYPPIPKLSNNEIDYLKAYQIIKKMKSVTKYQCEICHKVYDTPFEATQCEAKGVPTPQYKKGETVCLKIRYPDNNYKPFAKRIIKAIKIIGHVVEYELNDSVQIGKAYFVGIEVPFDPHCALATEMNLYKFGSVITDPFCYHQFFGKCLTDDFIDLEY